MKKKTAEYLMRAEQISSQHLRSNMGQGSTQTVVSGSLTNAKLCFIYIQESSKQFIYEMFFPKVLGAQCCPSTSRGGQHSPSEELRAYRVLGVIDKVSLSRILCQFVFFVQTEYVCNKTLCFIYVRIFL